MMRDTDHILFMNLRRKRKHCTRRASLTNLHPHFQQKLQVQKHPELSTKITIQQTSTLSMRITQVFCHKNIMVRERIYRGNQRNLGLMC